MFRFWFKIMVMVQITDNVQARVSVLQKINPNKDYDSFKEHKAQRSNNGIRNLIRINLRI